MEAITDIFDFLKRHLKILALTAFLGAILGYVVYLFNPGHRLAYSFISPDPLVNSSNIDPTQVNRILKDVFGNPEYVNQFSQEIVNFLEEKQDTESVEALKASFSLHKNSSSEELAKALSKYFLINVPENLLYRYLPYRWVYPSYEHLISMDLSNRYYFILKLPSKVKFENYVSASQSALQKIIEVHSKNVTQIEFNAHKQRLQDGAQAVQYTGEQYIAKQKEFSGLRNEFFTCTLHSRKLAVEELKKGPQDITTKALIEAFEEILPPKSILATYNLADAESSFAEQIFLQLQYSKAALQYLTKYKKTEKKLDELEKQTSECESIYANYFTNVDAAMRLVRVQLQAFTEELKHSARLDRIQSLVLPAISKNTEAMELNLLSSQQDPGLRNLLKYVSLGIALAVFFTLSVLIFTK